MSARAGSSQRQRERGRPEAAELARTDLDPLASYVEMIVPSNTMKISSLASCA
jgi:hypothetical protein